MQRCPIILDQSQTTWRRKVRIKPQRRDWGQGLSTEQNSFQNKSKVNNKRCNFSFQPSTQWLTGKAWHLCDYIKCSHSHQLQNCLLSTSRDFLWYVCMCAQTEAVKCSPLTKCTDNAFANQWEKAQRDQVLNQNLLGDETELLDKKKTDGQLPYVISSRLVQITPRHAWCDIMFNYRCWLAVANTSTWEITKWFSKKIGGLSWHGPGANEYIFIFLMWAKRTIAGMSAAQQVGGKSPRC